MVAVTLDFMPKFTRKAKGLLRNPLDSHAFRFHLHLIGRAWVIWPHLNEKGLESGNMNIMFG